MKKLKRSEATKLLEMLVEQHGGKPDPALMWDAVKAFSPPGGWEPERPALPKRLEFLALGEGADGMIPPGAVAIVRTRDGKGLAIIPADWEQTCREERIEAVRAAVIAYNIAHKADNPLAWTGASEDPAFNNPDWAEDAKLETFWAGTLDTEAEHVGEWPETLSVDWRLCGALGEMPMLYPPLGRFWPHRHRMGEAYEEAARRWQEEPELRKRISRALAYADRFRNLFPNTLGEISRILTGKEES
jgi:hypothetical protein